MAFPVLSAKLHKPEVPDKMISRLQLFEPCRGHQVVLVSAQAGSGKSTVISEWLSKENRPYCWYALDAWDNDMTQFFAYVIAAIQSIDVSAATVLEKLHDAYQSVGFEAFVKALIHQLHAIEQPFIFVFDDYHLIHNTQIHQVIQTLLGHLPKQMQLVLISREDPPFSLGKLRATKGLFELRISELKFTENEAKAFFLEHLVHGLEEDQMKVLIERNEGWVSGLQLTALSMERMADPKVFIEAFKGSHYYIMDYLMEEVLNNQTPELKAFLLKTAVLEFFSAELCETVVQLSPGAGSVMIEKLLKSNSFIIPIGASRQWYRYHHLFRDILLQALGNCADMKVSELHVLAGHWLKNEGYRQEAIHHFLKANADEEAAAMIECLWADMDNQLQAEQWLNMAKQLPLAILERSPVLAMGYGWALLDIGDVIGSGPWFERAQALYDQYLTQQNSEGILVHDTVQFELLPALLASARGYAAATSGDVEAIFKHTQEALDLIPNGPYKKRGFITMLQAVAHWSAGELHEAEHSIKDALDHLKSTEMSLVYHTIQIFLGELYIAQGRYLEAQDLLMKLLEKIQRDQKLPILLASLYLGLAKLEFLQGNTARAYEWLETSKHHGAQYALMDWQYKYYLLLARIYCEEGFYDLARECVRESHLHYVMNPVPEDVSIEAMRQLIDGAEAEKIVEQKMAYRQKPSTSPLKKEVANDSLMEPLTVRELEVLQLIAFGLSNQDICNTLFLALSTVKSYNQTIFQKLQVKRRTEAVAKANELGLVSLDPTFSSNKTLLK